MMKSLAIGLLMLLLSTPLTQDPIQPRTTLAVEEFMEAQRIGEANARSFFVFATTARHYTIRHDGLGESYGASSVRKKLDLRMGTPGRLERVYYLEYEGDLLLIYEVRNNTSGWGYIERFNQRTLKASWVTPVSSFNIGGLVESESLYVVAADFVAKVDLQSGKYVWQIKDSEAVRGTQFGVPQIKGNVLVLEDENGKTMELDKSSGTILAGRS
jgi:hypothetical protein